MPFTAIAVADGLGSLPDSGEAAQRAVDACSAAWSDVGKTSRPRVVDVAGLHADIVADLGGDGSTTLLSAVATEFAKPGIRGS